MTPDYREGLCAVKGILGDELVTGAAQSELTGYKSGDLLFLLN